MRSRSLRWISICRPEHSHGSADLTKRRSPSHSQVLTISADGWHLCSCAEVLLEKPFEAVSKARKTVKYHPDKGDGYWALVVAALECGGASEAIRAFEKFSVLDPSSSKQLIDILADGSGSSDHLIQFLRHFGRTPSGNRPSANSGRTAARSRETRRLSDQDFKLAFARIINAFLLDQEKADPGDELLQYDEVVEPYYKEGALQRSEILRQMQNLRIEWPSRSLRLMEILRYRSFGPGVVVVTYRVKYRFANGNKVRQGEMTQSILLTTTPREGWLVSGIETHQ